MDNNAEQIMFFWLPKSFFTEKRTTEIFVMLLLTSWFIGVTNYQADFTLFKVIDQMHRTEKVGKYITVSNEE